MPKTIAIDARIINSTTGRYVERLVHYLEEIDTANKYLILVPKKDLLYYKPANPNFTVIEADFPNYSITEQTGLLQLLNKLKPDLVHFCMPQQPVGYRGLHITTIHDLTLLTTYNSDKNYLIYKTKQLIGRWVFKKIGKTSAHIITPTEYTKKAYAKFAQINPKKITVTYEGSELTTSKREVYRPLAGKNFLLYVGSQSDYKNIRRLMRAHQELRKKHPDLLLVLVGRIGGKNGAALTINKTWAELQKFKGIIFTGFLPDEQMLWCMQHCATYVFPSLMEGFGLPALEAMRAGAAVTSSNATCLPEVYGEAVEYFNPTDITDMALAIERVITNQKRHAELVSKGAMQAARYSWRKMAEQTHDIYNNALRTIKTD